MMRFFSVLLLFAFMIIGCSRKAERNTSSDKVAEVEKSEVVPIINVFLENSGSMDGYVEGVTEFEQSIYSLLSDIRISKVSDSLNLFYINSNIIPQGSDVESFINNLDSKSFRDKGGNRSSSDFSDVLKKVLEETSKNEVSIFISDCIFSPGKDSNAAEYLINQQIGIKNAFASALQINSRMSVVVLQLNSKFKGSYYNINDEPVDFDGERPFYIWFMGSHKYLKNIFSKVNIGKLKGGSVQNIFVQIPEIEKLKYGLLRYPKKGNFTQVDYNTIEDAKYNAATGGFMFAVGVDFSDVLLGDKYLLDLDNYEVSDKGYRIDVSKQREGKYTHNILFSTDRKIIPMSVIRVVLKNEFPKWVESSNDDVGVDIQSKDSQGKTFGLKYLLGGVYDAYEQDGCFMKFKINVKS
ncbi:hypothetical protein [Ornithobacterium rhinotracheale]